MPSMRSGGAERVVSRILQGINRQRIEPILVLINKEGPFLVEIPPDIRIVNLNCKRVRNAPLKIIKTISEFRPDTVFSSIGHLNLMIALVKPFCGRSIRFVARESTFLSYKNKVEYNTGFFGWLYSILYRRFDIIIVLAESMKKDLVSNYNVPSERVAVINNPFDADRINVLADQGRPDLLDPEKINLLTIGRLQKVKRFHIPIIAMASLGKRYHLTILGQGPEKDNLIATAESHGVKDRVTFAGFQANPYAYMSQADILIQSSEYEGFPNVIIEANGLGLPVVAINCPGGTAEIVKDGFNGILLENSDIGNMVEGIKKAAMYRFNNELIIQYINHAFNFSEFIDKYNQLFIQQFISLAFRYKSNNFN